VGRRLLQARREIDFLVRPRQATELSQRRPRILDGTRTQTIDARTVTVSSLTGPYDLMLVGVNAQAQPAAVLH
jgi:2-dehydropantoate 2-reductase